jgi:hypothetical protein
MRGFTSTVDWPSLKIGPETALTPKEKEAAAKKANTEEINEVF